MSAPILISLPGYVGSDSSVASLAVYSDSETSQTSSGRAKKRRLDYLSWEEKVLRKKLKNRVAAQTSRDRKKAKMDEMEHSLSILQQQNETLIGECQSLRELNEKLLAENADLRGRMSSTGCGHQVCSVGRDTANEGPAASADSNPLLKGRASRSAAHLLLKILVTCLLLPNSSIPTTWKNWPSLRKVCSKISQADLKQIRQKIASGDIPLPTKDIALPAWWGPHQSSWNPVNIEA